MPTTDAHITNTAAVLREQLELLERERAMAALAAMVTNDRYMADLVHEVQAVRSAYVGAAVTEIASLRSALGAPLLG